MARHHYKLTVLAHGRAISWETPYPQTAHKWFRFTVEHGRTIDTGEAVSLVALQRNGVEIKAAAISDPYASLR